jgi:DNA-binding XRE family transcriptional regulator
MPVHPRRLSTNLGRRMRMWRADWNFTQAEAADVAGVSLSTWKRWESGVMTPELRGWQRMMMLMDGPLDPIPGGGWRAPA